jgi:hypothetical protein
MSALLGVHKYNPSRCTYDDGDSCILRQRGVPWHLEKIKSALHMQTHDARRHTRPAQCFCELRSTYDLQGSRHTKTSKPPLFRKQHVLRNLTLRRCGHPLATISEAFCSSTQLASQHVESEETFAEDSARDGRHLGVAHPKTWKWRANGAQVLHLPSAPAPLVPLSCLFLELLDRPMRRRVCDAYCVECSLSHFGHDPVIRNLSVTEATVSWALSDPRYLGTNTWHASAEVRLFFCAASTALHWPIGFHIYFQPAECRQAPVSCHYLAASGAVISSQPLTPARRFRSLRSVL